MANKFLIPFVLLLLFSLVYNFIKIDNRMPVLKNENGIHVLGIAASITGIILCIVVFRLNSVNKIIKNAKE